MAEFAITAMNRSHPDPVKDKRGCYKLYDIVEVKEDGFKWGKKDTLPYFYIVKVPGLEVTECIQYKYPECDLYGETITRRLWKIAVDILPSVIKNKLFSDGVIRVTWSQIKSYVINKKDGTPAG